MLVEADMQKIPRVLGYVANFPEIARGGKYGNPSVGAIGTGLK
jgi:hypothetical protein